MAKIGDARRALFSRSETEDLPIRIGIQRLYKELILAISRFPKIYKTTLGVDVREKLGAFRDFVNKASQITNKQTALREASVALQSLRDILWTCYELRCFSGGYLGLVGQLITELGAQLGGWIKAENK